MYSASFLYLKINNEQPLILKDVFFGLFPLRHLFYVNQAKDKTALKLKLGKAVNYLAEQLFV